MSEEMRRLVPQRFYTHHYQEVSFKTSFQNCVLKALQARRWRQVESGPWLLQWTEKERTNDVFEEKLTPAQRVNHFRLWGQLCRKDMMIKNIRKHKRQLQKDKVFVEEDWDFLPLTFFLPSEYIMFAEEFRKKGGLWIMKPTSRCQGQGIFIVDKLAQVAPYRHKIVPVAAPQPQLIPKPALPNFKAKPQEEKRDEQNDESDNQQGEERNEEGPAQSYLIQQYISRPLLLGYKKFDLRIYCLCTNYSQLTAWLYRSGFARFTHQPYNTEDIGHLQGHLTNVEIQKHSENYDQIRGGKWLVDRLKVFLLSRYAPSRVQWSFAEIRDIIIRSLQSVQRSILPSRNSFQLYGYDFMLDADLKPWLIQINGGPSMTANTDFDCRLKCGLIDDVLSIVDVEGLLTGTEMNVGGFDLIVDKGQRVRQPPQSSVACLLGARNQRIKVMRHLARSLLQRKTREEQAEDAPDEEPKVKQREKAKDKLLPNFYYNMRRQEDIDQQSGQKLKDELEFLEETGNKDQDFSSLRKYLQSDA